MIAKAAEDGSGPAGAPQEGPEDEATLRAAKARDAAFVLPFAGLAAFMPPVIGVFAFDLRPFGAPAIVVYIFAVWALLIAAARFLSRRLVEGGAAGRPAPDASQDAAAAAEAAPGAALNPAGRGGGRR